MGGLFQVSSVRVMDIETGRVFHDVAVGDLGRIRRYVHDTAVAGGCEAEAVDELIVAVNEAIINIVRHGYQNEPGEIKVIVDCGPELIAVILLDDAPGFDPTLAPSPDTMLPLQERPLGGMGVHMRRAFCDELSYRRLPAGGNELTMLKRYNG